MRKNFGAKPILYPKPVFIISAYSKDGVANAMNAAWGGLSEENEISICISPEHKTTENILHSGAFIVSIADQENLIAADYVGITSGNDVPNKIEKAGWHTEKSEFVNAPLICEVPMALECRLKSYDEEGCLLRGEIVNVNADERILGEDGKIDLTKFTPITYDPVHHRYYKLGEKVGTAFSDGKILK